ILATHLPVIYVLSKADTNDFYVVTSLLCQQLCRNVSSVPDLFYSIYYSVFIRPPLNSNGSIIKTAGIWVFICKPKHG
ncbi:MAG: hypothetical protein IKE43_10700, partial [Coriobacteriales bacterium]|nr:hypothetical protein [Coriobacteriales bacterium]